MTPAYLLTKITSFWFTRDVTFWGHKFMPCSVWFVFVHKWDNMVGCKIGQVLVSNGTSVNQQYDSANIK